MPEKSQKKSLKLVYDRVSTTIRNSSSYLKKKDIKIVSLKDPKRPISVQRHGVENQVPNLGQKNRRKIAY